MRKQQVYSNLDRLEFKEIVVNLSAQISFIRIQTDWNLKGTIAAHHDDEDWIRIQTDWNLKH